MTADLKQRLQVVEELLKKYKVLFLKIQYLFVILLFVPRPLLSFLPFMFHQDFWDYWETYKCLVETSANPEYLLIVDAWQQLKFLELEQLKK